MKPKLLHQQAMDYSFKAKQALNENKYGVAFELYKVAADLESQVAEFYFDKPELEPTRSVVIRSAAFLNLKAGLYARAQKFIFFGLLHSTDELIISQLNDALELTVSLKNLSPEAISAEFHYINLLRQRSIHYILEPTNLSFGKSISLEMLKDFSEGYLKSLKAFAKSKLRKILEIENEIELNLAIELDKLINPLITNTAYGSFKFSIANDFQVRIGEKKELAELKANIVPEYHNEIFINALSDNEINSIKNNYNEDEINDIFRPLVKIKSNHKFYKIGYYDTENLNKIFVDRIINNQKKKLLPIKQISKEDIGELENSIIHKRNSTDGKISKTVILKEQLKSYEFDVKINQIEAKDHDPIILNDEIILSVQFNSDSGFKFYFDDAYIEFTDIEYERGLKGFHNLFYNKMLKLININEKNHHEQQEWEIFNRLIGNLSALKNKEVVV